MKNTHAAEPEPSLRSQRGSAASALHNKMLQFYPPQCSPSPKLQRLSEQADRKWFIYTQDKSQLTPRAGANAALPPFLFHCMETLSALKKLLLASAAVGPPSIGYWYRRTNEGAPLLPGTYTTTCRRHTGQDGTRLTPNLLLSQLCRGVAPHLAGLTSRWQHKVWHFLHVKLVGDRVWKDKHTISSSSLGQWETRGTTGLPGLTWRWDVSMAHTVTHWTHTSTSCPESVGWHWQTLMQPKKKTNDLWSLSVLSGAALAPVTVKSAFLLKSLFS